MKVHFFEEFPTESSLAKAKLVSFSSRVYIAARSVKEFLEYKSTLQSFNPTMEAGYWAILPQSYWISGFANIDEIQSLHNEIQSYLSEMRGVPLLLDLELPFRNKSLFQKNLFKIFRTKRAIQSLLRFCNQQEIEVITAEYPIPFWVGQQCLRLLGVRYNPQRFPHKRIITIYTSILLGWDRSRKLEKILKWWFKGEAKKHRNVQFGLGLTSGVFGATAVLSPEELQNDLQFVQESGSDTAVLFRLNGIDEPSFGIIDQFLDK